MMTLTDDQVLLDQIVLLLAGRLSEEAMVLDTALLSLKPGKNKFRKIQAGYVVTTSQ